MWAFGVLVGMCHAMLRVSAEDLQSDGEYIQVEAFGRRDPELAAQP